MNMSFFRIANSELELRCGEPQASCLGLICAFIYIYMIYGIYIHYIYISVCVRDVIFFKKKEGILRDPSDHFGPSCPCPGWLVANWGETGTDHAAASCDIISDHFLCDSCVWKKWVGMSQIWKFKVSQNQNPENPGSISMGKKHRFLWIFHAPQLPQPSAGGWHWLLGVQCRCDDSEKDSYLLDFWIRNPIEDRAPHCPNYNDNFGSVWGTCASYVVFHRHIFCNILVNCSLLILVWKQS